MTVQLEKTEVEEHVLEVEKSKTPIIILGLPKHDDPFTSTPYQLAVEFAKYGPVWYVSHPFTWIDFFQRIKKRSTWKRLKATFQKGIVAEKNEYAVNLIYLPITFPNNMLPAGKLYELLSKVNHRIVAKTLNLLIRKNNLKNYVFVNSHDFYFGRIYKYLPKPYTYIYHCIDPIIKPTSKRHGIALEKEAATAANLVISTSAFLQRKMEGFNPKSYCVANAANFNLSNLASELDTEIHPSVKAIEGKKVGYIGNIERRINYEWLINIFKKNTDWQLVMVGPHEAKFIPEEFLNLPNLHLLPPVPHHQLPTILKGFDVAMIPFVKDEVSAQIYPLKLFEYMGSGKPVVTSDFNEEAILPFRKKVYLGTTEAEFEKAIDNALNETDPLLAEDRMLIASQNDWSARGKQFLEYINSIEDATNP